MTNQKENHLTEDQICRALVDKADLPETAKKHLAGCPQCHGAVKAQKKALEALGRMADQYSPKPGKNVIIPETAPISTRTPWRAVLGTAVAALLIVMMGYSTFLKDTPISHDPADMETAFGETDSLMMAVTLLSEEALPREYLDMTGEDTEEDEDDEDFLEFMIPAITNDDVSKNNNTGGLPC